MEGWHWGERCGFCAGDDNPENQDGLDKREAEVAGTEVYGEGGPRYALRGVVCVIVGDVCGRLRSDRHCRPADPNECCGKRRADLSSACLASYGNSSVCVSIRFTVSGLFHNGG
uniref:Uncharacterized protein n=1 Tax=Physcomitrium patens TaxID=3218 RepID=A0A2K1IIP6_PHYPA|nr:hypothetical protein PHYPA_027837 [Physcomitrium patens]